MTTRAWRPRLAAAIARRWRRFPRIYLARPACLGLAAVAGFFFASAAISAVIAALALVPKGPFSPLLHQMTDYAGNHPVVLVIGSSFSAAGIDSQALGQAIESNDPLVEVQLLAVGGAPHIERLHYLKEYLARSKQKPQLVLFEIAGGYDNEPLYQVHQMRFSDRMIEAMDPSGARWAFHWLLTSDRPGFWWRIPLGGEILGQLAVHLSRISYFWRSSPLGAGTAYDPGSSTAAGSKPISDGEAIRLLQQAATTNQLKPDWPAKVPSRWMSDFLAEEISLLRLSGVQRFAFYSVPSMQGADVAYARQFCAALREFPCIVAEDAPLLAALQHGADWYNFDHLQGAGRELFSNWLRDRLTDTGVWPRTSSPLGSQAKLP